MKLRPSMGRRGKGRGLSGRERKGMNLRYVMREKRGGGGPEGGRRETLIQDTSVPKIARAQEFWKKHICQVFPTSSHFFYVRKLKHKKYYDIK
jgi:hypothetical protein